MIDLTTINQSIVSAGRHENIDTSIFGFIGEHFHIFVERARGESRLATAASDSVL